MSKKDEKDINISKLDKSLEGQGLLEDADDAEYERTLAQQRRAPHETSSPASLHSSVTGPPE